MFLLSFFSSFFSLFIYPFNQVVGEDHLLNQIRSELKTFHRLASSFPPIKYVSVATSLPSLFLVITASILVSYILLCLFLFYIHLLIILANDVVGVSFECTVADRWRLLA